MTGEVALVPDPGFSVVLQGFDVGGWGGDRTGWIRVLDGLDNVLLDSGPIPVPGLGGRFSYTGPPLDSDTRLRIILDLYGTLGLDDVLFAQVPEPGTLLLLLTGLAGLAARTGRRERRI